MSDYLPEVRAYLADCAKHQHLLNPRYHPTEDGAVKMIPHGQYPDPEECRAAARAIRSAYRTLDAAGKAHGPATP
jgi:hypothetical protein